MRGVFCTLAFAALPLAPLRAMAATPMQTDDGKLVHWSLPVINVGVDPATKSARLSTTAIEQAIDEASSAWNVLPEMRVKFARATKDQPAQVLVRFCQRRWPHAEGLLGHAEFEANKATGVVSNAVVEVNECDYSFVGPDDLAEGHMDLQAVLTHELGHVLGLAHSADPQAVMFTSTGTVRQRRPTLDDRSGIAACYGAPDPLAQPSPVAVEAAPTLPVEEKGPELYTGGKEAPVAFELPWPLNTGNQTVKFVPTVLPLPNRPSPPMPRTQVEASKPVRAPSAQPARVTRPRVGADAPVAQELDWPDAAPAKVTPEPRAPKRARGDSGGQTSARVPEKLP